MTTDLFADLDTLWADPESTPVERRELDYGNYGVFVEEVEWKRSKAGQPMFVIRMRVNDNTVFKGRIIQKNYTLSQGWMLRTLKEDLQKMKIELPKTLDMAAREKLSEACLDRQLLIARVPNKMEGKENYPKIFINAFNGMAEHAKPAGDKGPKGTDEIPF